MITLFSLPAGKHSLVIANRQLEYQATMHETIAIKSGAWDENNVFVYTTLNHLKYVIPNGGAGAVLWAEGRRAARRTHGSSHSVWMEAACMRVVLYAVAQNQLGMLHSGPRPSIMSIPMLHLFPATLLCHSPRQVTTGLSARWSSPCT